MSVLCHVHALWPICCRKPVDKLCITAQREQRRGASVSDSSASSFRSAALWMMNRKHGEPPINHRPAAADVLARSTNETDTPRRTRRWPDRNEGLVRAGAAVFRHPVRRCGVRMNGDDDPEEDAVTIRCHGGVRPGAQAREISKAWRKDAALGAPSGAPSHPSRVVFGRQSLAGNHKSLCLT